MNNITVTAKQINSLEDVVYSGLIPAGGVVGTGGGSESDLYYSKIQLDAGQLDNRYYTETEVNNLLASGYVDTSGIPVDNQIAIFTDKDTIEGVEIVRASCRERV